MDSEKNRTGAVQPRPLSAPENIPPQLYSPQMIHVVKSKESKGKEKKKKLSDVAHVVQVLTDTFGRLVQD